MTEHIIGLLSSSGRRWRLDPGQQEQFGRDGFLPGPVILDPAQLAEVRATVDGLVWGKCPGRERLLVFREAPCGAQQNQFHAVGLWLAHRVLHDLVFHPAIAVPVAQLLGHPRPRLFRDQLFLKPAFSSGTIPWHQDYSDWTHTAPPRHITCWIALDDTSPENGCVHYLPGARQELLAKISSRDSMSTAFSRLPSELQSNFSPQPVSLPAGACVFHHCLTIHGSYGNRSPAARRAISITYMHPETRSVCATRPVIPGGPVIAEGAVIEGPLFPLLETET